MKTPKYDDLELTVVYLLSVKGVEEHLKMFEKQIPEDVRECIETVKARRKTLGEQEGASARSSCGRGG